jgi:Sulfotransferase domain
MLLPTFLGIGAPRAGTTRLHGILASHPDVAMPSRRKELYFFDENFHRGLAWYAASFDPPSGGTTPRAIGEITPFYMYREQCRPRIRAMGSVDRFIVCVRNPVDLLWSAYRYNAAAFDFRGSLHEFMQAFPEEVSTGFYARALRPWFEDFGRDRFLLLRFEDITGNPGRLTEQLAWFLDIDRDRFPTNLDDADVERNESFTPRYRRLHSLAKRSARQFHRADLGWVVKLAKRSSVRRLVKARSTAREPEISPAERAELHEMYADDIRQLEDMTGLAVTV